MTSQTDYDQAISLKYDPSTAQIKVNTSHVVGPTTYVTLEPVVQSQQQSQNYDSQQLPPPPPPTSQPHTSSIHQNSSQNGDYQEQSSPYVTAVSAAANTGDDGYLYTRNTTTNTQENYSNAYYNKELVENECNVPVIYMRNSNLPADKLYNTIISNVTYADNQNSHDEHVRMRVRRNQTAIDCQT